MAKRQYFSLGTSILILGLNSIGMAHVAAANIHSQQQLISLAQSQHKLSTSVDQGIFNSTKVTIKNNMASHKFRKVQSAYIIALLKRLP